MTLSSFWHWDGIKSSFSLINLIASFTSSRSSKMLHVNSTNRSPTAVFLSSGAEERKVLYHRWRRTSNDLLLQAISLFIASIAYSASGHYWTQLQMLRYSAYMEKPTRRINRDQRKPKQPNLITNGKAWKYNVAHVQKPNVVVGLFNLHRRREY